MKKTSVNEKKNAWAFLLVFFMSSIGCIVLGIVCLRGADFKLSECARFLISIVFAIVISAFCGLSTWATLTKRERLEKSAVGVYLLLITAFLSWYVLQKTDFFGVVGSSETLQAYLERTGVWMPVFYVTLQFLQVVVLPIPSVVSTLAGVAIFEAWRATIYSLLGILLGSFLAFWIGRKLGYRAVRWMLGEETLQKWQKKLKGKDELVLTLMFLLPLFPDDVLCFLAGLSTMSARYYCVMITISRVLAVSATCYSVDLIPFTTWWGIALWCVLLLAVVAAFVFAWKHLDEIQKWLKRKKRGGKKLKAEEDKKR